MGIRQVIESDISGKLHADTVAFGLGDAWYEIDLTEEERAELEASLRRYVDKGRQVGKRRPPKRTRYPKLTPAEREEIRVWGNENGHDPAPYGAIPMPLLAAYYEAHDLDLEARIESDNAKQSDDENDD